MTDFIRLLLCLSCIMSSTSIVFSGQEKSDQQNPAEQATDQEQAGQIPTEPPVPGPDLLKYTPEQIEAAYAGKRIPEGVAMYLVIARGGQLDGSSGWFGPSVTRYTWKWLADLHGVPEEGMVEKSAFKGSEELFRKLDRDRDQMISPFDLDWSDGNPWVRQSYMVNRMFRRMDASGDGELTQEEIVKFYDRARSDSAALRFEQLRDALIPPGNMFIPGDEPKKETLIKGLMEGEIGSLQEGPSLDEMAPDVELTSLADQQKSRLSDRIGKKPLVVVFGNFTCGPFRSMYPTVEAVFDRQKDHADFIMIYVREAHPTDGWAMKSNESVGVAVAQPTTFEERVKVATMCSQKLNPKIPMFVDDLHDSAGHGYSGMPARLYIIDTDGRVAYKSGRGPFGFKPEEMEQVLVMLTLDNSLKSGAPATSTTEKSE